MTKHTPDFSYLRGLKPVIFTIDECLKIAEYRSSILRPETKLSEPIIILADAVKAKDTRIAELEADLAAEREKVERFLETVKSKAYRTIIRCKPAYVVNHDDIIEVPAATEPKEEV
ncbi:MAG TPA: hypothetical protein VLH56_18680 [Dissulfurispiraceae bacterium]|nr:hypothetical protein [Dissulfurispiraceae bacterium]